MEQITEYKSYSEFKERLDSNLKQQAAGFVEAGYLLKIARDTDILRESGYKSLAEFAKAEYGFTADVVSRYVKINDRFSKNGYSVEMDDKYQKFGYTKLVEMLNLPIDVIEEIPEEATRSQIRELNKEYQEESKITDIEVMLEESEPGQVERRNILEEVMYEYVKQNIDIFQKLAKAETYDNLLDLLAPSGVNMLTARIPGKGKYMISIKGLDENITVISMRDDTKKEMYTWQQALESIIYMYADRDIREIYPEKEKIAPAQIEEKKVDTDGIETIVNENETVSNKNETVPNKNETNDNKDNNNETVTESDFNPAPVQMTSICYSCAKWQECDVRSTITTECNEYIDKNEVYKTEEQRYSEEQDRIDKQTAKILKERADEEKLEHLPSEVRRVHEIDIANSLYNDTAEGIKTFVLCRKDKDYKVDDEIDMHERKYGKYTERHIKAKIVYIQEDYTGLEENYCILGIKVFFYDL